MKLRDLPKRAVDDTLRAGCVRAGTAHAAHRAGLDEIPGPAAHTSPGLPCRPASSTRPCGSPCRKRGCSFIPSSPHLRLDLQRILPRPDDRSPQRAAPADDLGECHHRALPGQSVDVPLEHATPGPGRDGAEPRMEVAALPPWTAVHLHGAHTNARNDGWSENAGLPGSAQLSDYPNMQRASTLWYHDHASGITA